ncbi:MAG: ADP-glyceromanno-heptose 6-epimerase [Alphaproteobacteria bacterium]
MIIVTGGAGFIGSNIVATLRARVRDALVVADWLGAGDKWRNLRNTAVDHVIAPEELRAFLDRNRSAVRAVVHMGANSSTTERDVDHLAWVNIGATADLWDWCTEHQKALIYASSGATYGDGSAGFDDDIGLDYLTKLKPLNPYGWSKHVSDVRIARIVAQGVRRPPQWLGLKFFNVYGPNEAHKGDMMSVVAKIFPKAQEGETIDLFRSHRPDYEDGGQLRDFVYVKDCAEVVAWALENPSASGLFNLGTGKARAFRDLAKAVFAALNREPKIRYIDTPAEIRDKYQYFTEAKMERLRAAGYTKAFTPLEGGVFDYVQKYLSADDPYR